MSTFDSSCGTQASLLRRAQMRDEVAWRELVELYSPLVIGWCRRCRVGTELTADCVQEVFAAVARSLVGYYSTGEQGAFRGWLWIITRNKLRDLIRSDNKQFRGEGGSSARARMESIVDPQSIPDADPSDSISIHRLNQRGLAQIEASFASQTWRAFVRSVIDGLPTDVVAQELAMSPASVRQARCRVLRRLRQQLGDSD